MPLIPFLPFVLFPLVKYWDAPQAAVCAVILFVALFKLLATSKQSLSINAMCLPYLLFPVYCFANSNPQLEFFSEEVLWQISQFGVFATVFFMGKEDGQKFKHSCLLASSLWLTVQVVTTIIGIRNFDIQSVFGRENGYQFVNMVMLFVCISIFLSKSESAFWKRFSVAIFACSLFSIFIGDTFREKELAISHYDSVNVWLGLLCGFLISLFFILLKKKNAPQKFFILFSLLFVALWVATPIIAAQLQFWQPDFMIHGRITYWRTALNMFYEYPLFGVGNGSFGSVYYDYYSIGLPNMDLASTPHNEIMAVLSENGIMGLIFETFLLGFPLVCFSAEFAKNGSKKALLFLFGIFTIMSTTEISEAPQLFVSSFLAMWLFTAFAAKECTYRESVLFAKINFSIPLNKKLSLIFMILCSVVLIFCLYDRTKQIASQVYSRSFEIKGVALQPKDYETLYSALQISSKNSAALYNLSSIYILNGNYEKALLTLETLEDISGTMYPIHSSRFLIYKSVGDTLKACAEAKNTMPKTKDSDDFLEENCVI